MRYKDEVHNGEHAAIVSQEEWDRVQTVLKRNGRNGGTMVRNKYGALLKGLLHCGSRKCAMTPSHSTKNGNKTYRYYVCSATQKRGVNVCATRSVPAGEIERFVVDQIRDIGRDPEILAATIRQAHAKATEEAELLVTDEKRLERELAGHHRELQNTVKHANGKSDGHTPARLAEVQERIVDAERQFSTIRNELEMSRRQLVNPADVAKALQEFEPIWQSLKPREQARLFQLLIDRIDYDGSDGTISISFHNDGITALRNHEFAGDAA